MPTLQQTRLLLGRAQASPALFSDDFNRADGPIGNGWTGLTWTVSGNKAVNTPTQGAELFVNGGFGADANWTKGTGWTIAAGVASHAAGGSGSITETVSIIGGWFREVWTLLNYSAGNFQARPGFSSSARTANATYTDSGRATATTAGVTGSTSGAGDIDNLSLKQLTLSTLFCTKDFGNAFASASVKAVIVNGNACGIVLNLDSTSSPANFIVGYHDGVNARLEKSVAGTYTSLINTAATYSAGAAIEVRQTVLGTYQLWYNGVQIGTNQVVADAAILAATKHGLFQTYEGNTLDDFAVA